MSNLTRKCFTYFVAVIVVITTLLLETPLSLAAEDGLELRNLAEGLEYEWSVDPNSAYPDTNFELTNGQYATDDFTDEGWQGHSRDPQQMIRTVTFDLGENKSIAEIKANFLQDSSQGILFPSNVSFSVSTNGVEWGKLADVETQIPLWDTTSGATQTFTWDGSTEELNGDDSDMVYAQYVQVSFPLDFWIFIDEIEIWGVDERAPSAIDFPQEEIGPEPNKGYLQAGEATAGINDLVLLYNGSYEGGLGDWSKEDIIPYISYVDETGSPTDWFYDGVLYLGLKSPSGRDFHADDNPTNLEDWKWYLDKTFSEEGDMHQLNEAAKEVAEKLNEPNHKVKVVTMIPFASHQQSDFGDVDGDGVSENFNFLEVGEDEAHHNKEKAIEWYINEVTKRWDEAGYENLELSGLYWIREAQSLGAPYYPELVQYTSELVHDEDLKFFWIPFFQAPRFQNWETFGFDAAVLQPGHFFDSSTDFSRFEDASAFAQRYGMGVEIETDERMLTEDQFRERYINYLNGGVTYGYMNNVFKGYYQGNNSLLQAARSDDPNTRILYDWMYQFVQGTYEIQEELYPDFPETPEPEEPSDPDPEDPETPDPEQPSDPDPEDPETPEPEQPEDPDTDQPETPEPEQPEDPDTDQPETPEPEQPEDPDTDQSETPDPEQPENSDGEQPKAIDSGSDDQDSEIPKKEAGSKLPNTATNTFNLMLLGIMLMVAGTIYFSVYRRKRSKGIY